MNYVLYYDIMLAVVVVVVIVVDKGYLGQDNVKKGRD